MGRLADSNANLLHNATGVTFQFRDLLGLSTAWMNSFAIRFQLSILRLDGQTCDSNSEVNGHDKVTIVCYSRKVEIERDLEEINGSIDQPTKARQGKTCIQQLDF